VPYIGPYMGPYFGPCFPAVDVARSLRRLEVVLYSWPDAVSSDGVSLAMQRGNWLTKRAAHKGQRGNWLTKRAAHKGKIGPYIGPYIGPFRALQGPIGPIAYRVNLTVVGIFRRGPAQGPI